MMFIVFSCSSFVPERKMQMIIQPQNQEIQSLGQITNPVGQVISNNKLYLRGGLKMLEKCGHLSKT